MNTEILNEYTDETLVDGALIKIIVKCYKEPITKNERIGNMHTEVSLYDGDTLYGRVFLPNPIEPEDSAAAMDSIKLNAKAYKH